jgi:hypothetical protein
MFKSLFTTRIADYFEEFLLFIEQINAKEEYLCFDYSSCKT